MKERDPQGFAEKPFTGEFLRFFFRTPPHSAEFPGGAEEVRGGLLGKNDQKSAPVDPGEARQAVPDQHLDGSGIISIAGIVQLGAIGDKGDHRNPGPADNHVIAVGMPFPPWRFDGPTIRAEFENCTISTDVSPHWWSKPVVFGDGTAISPSQTEAERAPRRGAGQPLRPPSLGTTRMSSFIRVRNKPF